MKISHVLKVRFLCTLKHEFYEHLCHFNMGVSPGDNGLLPPSLAGNHCLCLLGWLGFRDLATLFFVKVCMFIREAGLAWLSKFIRRKMWRGKISETEPPRFHPALVKRSRNNREVKSSQAPPPVRPMGREEQIISLLTPFPPSLSSLWYQYLGHSYSHERLAGQPGEKLI